MTPDAAYMTRAGLVPACHLRRAGQWDAALALVPPEVPELRAEILVERNLFRLDPPGEAIASVRALPDSPLATMLLAQLEYWRQLFKLDGEPIMDDPVAGFADVATDPALAGWATFHHAVSIRNLRDDAVTGEAGFARALELDPGDRFLESHVVRHQAEHVLYRGHREDGIALLRRSYNLRAALGARPHTAAAAHLLARELPPGAEADELRSLAQDTARELEIPWLQG